MHDALLVDRLAGCAWRLAACAAQRLLAGAALSLLSGTVLAADQQYRPFREAQKALGYAANH
jgi:hypothetical protein